MIKTLVIHRIGDHCLVKNESWMKYQLDDRKDCYYEVATTEKEAIVGMQMMLGDNSSFNTVIAVPVGIGFLIKAMTCTTFSNVALGCKIVDMDKLKDFFLAHVYDEREFQLETYRGLHPLPNKEAA